MEEVHTEKNLTLRVDEQENEVTVHWEGKSSERDPATFISPILNGVLSKNKKIILNFKKLEYMNSSTVTPLLRIMDEIKGSNGSILIVFSRNLKWQELSFTALEIFKTPDGRINVVGE